MPLTDEQRSFYENSMEVIKGEVSELNQQIEDELAKVRDRIMELQNEKKSALGLYEATCNRLGVTNDLKHEEDAPIEEAG